MRQTIKRMMDRRIWVPDSGLSKQPPATAFEGGQSRMFALLREAAQAGGGRNNIRIISIESGVSDFAFGSRSFVSYI